MATSGRSRLVGLSGLLGFVALAVTGCSGGPSTPPGSSAAPSTTAPSTTASSSAPAGSPTASAVPSAQPPCEVDLPAGWRTALNAGTVKPDAGEQLSVVLGTSDGRTFVVSARGGTQRFEWRRGSDRGLVQDFGRHEQWQVLAPTWDGRYLAYRVDQSFSGFEDFSVYVWDSQGSGGPVKVAHGEKDASGELMQTPFVDPVLADGWVYWTQTRDRDPDHTVLSGRRLSDGRVERLSKGYGRAPVRFQDTLVWADSAKQGQTSTLRMLDLTTHRAVAVPATLAGVTGPYYLAGDADTLAWVGGSKGSQVWVWRAGWSAPRLVVDRARSPQFPRVAGDTVVYGTDDAMYAADLRSWSSARLTPEYGSVWADGGPVVTIGFAATSKGGGSTSTLVDTAKAGPLGRAGC